MVTIEEAFTDAWRSYRIAQGDDPAALPDPLGERRAKGSSGVRYGRGGRGWDTRHSEKEASVEPNSQSGGFLLEDEGGDDEVGEGHKDGLASKSAEGNTEDRIMRFLPLSAIPHALANLSLDSTDEYVLGLFAEVAVATDEPEPQALVEGSRRRKRGTDRVKSISLVDFKRVAEVLLDGENVVESADEQLAVRKASQRHAPVATGKSVTARPRRTTAKYNARYRDQAEDDAAEAGAELLSDEEEVFAGDVDVHQVADGSSEEDDWRPSKASLGLKAKHPPEKHKGRKSQSTSSTGGLRRSSDHGRKRSADQADKELSGHEPQSTAIGGAEESGDLSTIQRRQIHAAFQLLTQRLKRLKQDPQHADGGKQRISKSDVRMLVHSVGEKIPEREVRKVDVRFDGVTLTMRKLALLASTVRSKR